MSKRLLAIDIGNTHTVIGVFSGDIVERSWRVSTDTSKTADEWGVYLTTLFSFDTIRPEDLIGACISCVVPPTRTILAQMCKKYFDIDPIVVGPGIKTGLSIKSDNPREVGADRIVNAVAAYTEHGGPLIIIDVGTATTFCAISKNGEYLGGAIAPGMRVAAEALASRTAQLPRIEFELPRKAIGKDTVSCMQSGIVLGYMELISGMVRRIKAELDSNAKVIATGGMVPLLTELDSVIDVYEPDLMLKGLKIIYERNASP
ncbi:type III pantothenate kinase [Candidatus Hydrogenedentota bacterium]